MMELLMSTISVTLFLLPPNRSWCHHQCASLIPDDIRRRRWDSRGDEMTLCLPIENHNKLIINDGGGKENFYFNFNTFTPSPLISGVFSFLNERPVHHFKAIVYKQIQCLLTRATSQRILMTMMIQFPLKINIQFIYFIFYSHTQPPLLHTILNDALFTIHMENKTLIRKNKHIHMSQGRNVWRNE